MSSYRLVELQLIVPDPANRHEEFQIAELDASIMEHGLLENLVVREHFGEFMLVAGERRWKALRRIAERGDWPPSMSEHRGRVMCLVLGAGEERAALAQIVENAQRLDPSPWHVGRRFLELMAADLSQDEIGARIGKAASYVSRLSQIARGIAPSIVRRLDRLGPRCLTVGELLSIARLCDEITEEPDEAAQLAELQRLIGSGGRRQKKPPRAPGSIPVRERVAIRYSRIKAGQVRVPAQLRSTVELVLEYLEGRRNNLNPKKGAREE